jgi:hypothetical protein
MVSTSGGGLDRIIGDRSIDRNRVVDNIIGCEEKNMEIALQYVISQLLANSTLDYIDLTYDTHLDSKQEYRMGRGIVNFLLLTERCKVPPSYIDLLGIGEYTEIAEKALGELEKNGIISRRNNLITIQKDLSEIKRELKEKYEKHIEEKERKRNYTTGEYIY